MLFLTGSTGSREIIRFLIENRWGRIWIDRLPLPYKGEPWGFDNGAFTDWLKGKAFDGDLFLKRLNRAYGVGVPYLAVVPDIVAGGLRSLEFSVGWMNELPPDWPWFLAVQDGMTVDDVEPVRDLFCGIFLGGSDKFKATAYHWAELAHKYDKLFHYGRAGTPRKIRHAMESGADSCDSAFPLWARERLDIVRDTIATPDNQGKLWGVEAAALMP